MTAREITKKLRAWEAGRPIPRYDTIHQAIVSPDDALIVAFVRMAGESRPWGITWGTAAAGPRVASIPDGRVRDEVSELCAEFAEELLDHLRVHNWTYDPAGQKEDANRLRQVWLPNGQHIEMLHQLSYTYSQTKFGGRNQDILRALGRLSGWMFRETSRKGSQHVVSASRALSDAYVFPAQDARTAHLGFQLAWLETVGDRAHRMAAAGEAELLTISATLDPDLDRRVLSDLVEQWQTARRAGGDPSSLAAGIASALEPELVRRWDLTRRAYSLLANNDRPINPGVRALIEESQAEFWGQHQRIELRLNDPSLGPAFVAHPETDFHGSAAASRFLTYEAADEAFVGRLIHSDPELFAEALDAGDAVRGEVLSVSDLGSGRTTRPVWVLRLPPGVTHRLRENAKLTPHGSPGHEVIVLDLDVTEDALDVTLEWTGLKTRPLSAGLGAKPDAAIWVGQTVAFVTSDAADLTRRRSFRVWSAAKGPGAWLTHSKFPTQVEILGDDGGSDLLVDDVRQIVAGESA